MRPDQFQTVRRRGPAKMQGEPHRDLRCGFFLWWTLPGQSSRPRLLVGRGQVESLAALAAVDLGIGAELLSDLLAEEVPALEMTRAELALLVLLVAGAHSGDAALYFDAVAEGCDEFSDGNWFVRCGVLGVGHSGCDHKYTNALVARRLSRVATNEGCIRFAARSRHGAKQPIGPTGDERQATGEFSTLR